MRRAIIQRSSAIRTILDVEHHKLANSRSTPSAQVSERFFSVKRFVTVE